MFEGLFTEERFEDPDVETVESDEEDGWDG